MSHRASLSMIFISGPASLFLDKGSWFIKLFSSYLSINAAQVRDQLSRNEDLVPLLLSLLGRAAEPGGSSHGGSLRASAAAAAGSMGRSGDAGAGAGLAALASALDGIANGGRSNVAFPTEGVKQRADHEADQKMLIQMHAAGKEGGVIIGKFP